MRILTIVVVAAISLEVFASSKPTGTTQAPEEILERMAVQREMVATLSGHGRSTPGAGVRSSPKQRAATADWLFLALESIGLQPKRHDYRLPNVNGLVDLLLPPLRGTNVYATVVATRPRAPFIVIGAHYDSDPGSPGAGDNAAGVALVYTLGQALQARIERPFNYLLVFFDQEEDDEIGSKAFARFLDAGDFLVHSVHVTDLPGWDEDGDGEIEIQSPTPLLEQRYLRAAERIGVSLRVTKGGSSDNKSFLAAGYPTVGVFGDVTRHLHKPTDTYQTVDFVYLDRMTSLILDVVSALSDEASRNER